MPATMPCLPNWIMSNWLGLICSFPFVPWSSWGHDGAGGADPRHPHLRHLQAAVQQLGRLRSAQAERLPADRHGRGGAQHRPVRIRGDGARHPDADHHPDHHLGDPDHHRYGGAGSRSERARTQTRPGTCEKSSFPGPTRWGCWFIIFNKLRGEASRPAGVGSPVVNVRSCKCCHMLNKTKLKQQVSKAKT